jgi:hypothetical protein
VPSLHSHYVAPSLKRTAHTLQNHTVTNLFNGRRAFEIPHQLRGRMCFRKFVFKIRLL